jgi:hypothetical protein
MRVFLQQQRKRWLVYADAVYRQLPGLAEERLAALAGGGLSVSPLRSEWQGFSYQKQRALSCYASQLRGLTSTGRPGLSDVLAPERYWKLCA